MMAVLWVVLFYGSLGLNLVSGLPIESTPQASPHETNGLYTNWGSEGIYVLPALALVLTAVGLLFGCTWCYQHKDCKIFTASATHLHDVRSRSQAPDSGFSEPVNNNISEDNNNGPISLREMQNIANNNAAAYIVSENEERNRINRESVVEFEPLPRIAVLDPLERCADWFAGEDFPRNQLQYLREIGRGWFGRVVEGEIEDGPTSATVAVKILNQNASLEDKARFLDEARMYRDISHENVLPFIAKCLNEDPWMLMFELCSMDLQQYLEVNRPKMAILNESGAPLQIMCDVSAGLAHLHSRGYLYGTLWSGNVLVRGSDPARAVLGQYSASTPQHDVRSPEEIRHPAIHTASSEVWSLGYLLWEVCAWGAPPPHAPPAPHLPCPYRNHLYQVMQLCWNQNPENRPTAAQVHALLNHLHTTHSHTDADDQHFEERWQRLKPNTIPKIDEHVAIVHAPSTSTDSQFGSDLEFESAQTIPDSLSAGDTAVSRSSSIMSDKEPLSVQMKSDSLNNLHGSFEDVRNIYLTHNEAAALECHQGNIGLEEKEQDRSDSSVDPWLKDIITGSQDDVSYFKDVSDVIKNLDNILNSEKTSSSESSHQASPSRENLSLECKKDYPMQTSLVKSPGIRNFQNILEMGFESKSEGNETCEEDEREMIGTLSHSFERHSDSASQYTLENVTPETPIKDISMNMDDTTSEHNISLVDENKELPREELPNNILEDKFEVPKLKELCKDLNSVSSELQMKKDCTQQDDALRTETKSIDVITSEGIDKLQLSHVKETTEPENSLQSEQKGSIKIENFSDVSNLVNENIKDTNESNPEDTIVIDSDTNKELFDNTVDRCSAVLPVAETLVYESLKNENNITLSLNKENTETQKDFTQTDNNIIQVEQDKIDANLNLSNGLKEESNVLKEKAESFESTKSLTTHCPSIGNEEVISQMPIPSINNVDLFIENETKKSLDNNQCSDKAIISSDVCTPVVPDVSSYVQDSHMDLTEKEYDVGNGPVDTQTNLVKLRNYTELPDLVQVKEVTNALESSQLKPPLSPAVQSDGQKNHSSHSLCNEPSDQTTIKYNDLPITLESEHIKTSDEPSLESTVYMDFPCDNSNISTNNVKENGHRDSLIESFVVDKNDSTVYLDLPSVIREMDIFLQSERLISGHNIEFKENVCTSTPLGSNSSVDNVIENETLSNNYSKLPDCTTLIQTGVEQKTIPENLSPFESPTKSHPTDTFDDNSSVVLGPFENCALDVFKGVKSGGEFIDLPKEELLAFSSNFSDINLETPSPLRDSNFLNEVPDLVRDDSQADEPTASEAKPIVSEPPTDNTEETEEQSTTEKRISPLTPPNSPGNFLASTSHPYADELQPEPFHGIGVNELAIAENENNMNLEYSGPLFEEDVHDSLSRQDDAPGEELLGGNYGVVDQREDASVDEERMQRMKELRNELELKLPLAQVANIEPSDTWTEVPPPEEVIVSYPGLSPIAEETRHQLTAYENDDNWNISVRTESSESYPEPANNSTDEMTELPTGLASAAQQSREHSTYTIHSHPTYTLHKDATASKEITMTADSLNGSPLKKVNEVQSPVNDETYTVKDDEKECERISQISPFLLSPTTDTSAPDNSDLNAALSTLSKPTIPTDVKSSKPSETQCLSKATSIDSWCSNDTLYNVEENFDDLAMDPDLPLEFEQEPERDKSESEDTLTHNEDEKDASHCSTYIVHDSKSEACETFSPDSITANDNYTYTKVKTGTTPSVNTKSDVNDSTKNTQTKDLAYGTLGSGMPSYSNCTTELASGIDDAWKLPQPELVRRSPLGDVVCTPPAQMQEYDDLEFTSLPSNFKPKLNKMDSVEITCFKDGKDVQSPKVDNDIAISITSTPLTQLDADGDDIIPCPILQINTYDPNISPINNSCLHEKGNNGIVASFNKDEKDNENSINKDHTITLCDPSSVDINNYSEKFESFVNAAEMRPHDLGNNSHRDLNVYLVNNSSDKTIQEESCKSHASKDIIKNSGLVEASLVDVESFIRSAELRPHDLQLTDVPETGNFSENGSKSIESFLNSAVFKPQSTNSSGNLNNCLSSSQSFIQSAEMRPQDLSSDICDTASTSKSLEIQNRALEQLKESEKETDSLLLSSNRDSSVETLSFLNKNIDALSPNHVDQPSIILNPSFSSARETPEHDIQPNIFITDLDIEDENEQPHSIIITDSPLLAKVGLNQTFDVPKTESQFHEDKAIESVTSVSQNSLNKSFIDGSGQEESTNDKIKCNGSNEMFAIVNFLNEPFEELLESNVDDNDIRDVSKSQSEPKVLKENTPENKSEPACNGQETVVDGEGKVTEVTQDFLKNEKNFCQFDAYLPLMSDIRFTGPGAEIMSTSFTQDSPTEPTSPECERDSTTDKDKPSELLKEWDSDTDTHSTNSSSGEFIWKDGDGHETALPTTTHFQHQRDSGQPSRVDTIESIQDASSVGSAESGSGSGSEGDEVEFVPSSWDCRAAPAKSSLRSLEQPAEGKKRVVFKRQKYHCVYEYPRESVDLLESPAHYLPDLSTYCEWDPRSAEEAEVGYGQLFGAPSPLDMYPLRAGIAFGTDYDEDFYITSTARPFELGVLSTTSQFFPGMHLKQSLLPEDDFPPPPSPLPPVDPSPLPQSHTKTPSLDFTTPDSGVEDITPGSTLEEEIKMTESWKPDSTSSSESVSPSSPGGELGGLRHTRDKLKLDLPPSPHLPSPRHNRVFNFVLDKPKRPTDTNTPLVMSDETPVMMTLPVSRREDPSPEPTFSTFGKPTCKSTADTKNIVLTDNPEPETQPETTDQENPTKTPEIEEKDKVEPVKGEGTVLDSGDEDSGIESSSKATLERKPANVS